LSLDNLEFVQAAKTLSNRYIDEWKQEGKRVLGYYCSYVPLELIHAMNMLPFRIRGTTCNDTVLADAILAKINCSFVKATLNLALQGEYNFLDGMICENSCDHVRRMIDIWRRKVVDPNFPLFFLSIPHTITEAGLDWLKTEVNSFKEQLETTFSEKINEDALINSIQIFNENRRLLREIYDLRILNEPKILGSEFTQLIVANGSIPKEICNSELTNIMDILKDREGIKDYKARLMLIGSCVDNPAFMNIFEDVGGLIVTDSLCYGVRSFWDDVDLTSNPLNGLINAYYHRVSCPRMMDAHPTRLEFVKDQIAKAKVDGVILQRLEFCDLHGTDNMLLSHELEGVGIPVLNIDREYLMSDIGRFKTRVDAFIEQMMVK